MFAVGVVLCRAGCTNPCRDITNTEVWVRRCTGRGYYRFTATLLVGVPLDLKVGHGYGGLR